MDLENEKGNKGTLTNTPNGEKEGRE